MSSKVLERTVLTSRQRDVRWTEAEEIEDIIATKPPRPLIVEGNKLEVDSAQLETERVYSFDYLGVKMVLWKLPDNTIDLFQVVEE